jgi:hypothetical protein
VAGRFVPALWLALTGWSLSACYRYVPVTSDTTPMTGEGRVLLTDAGTVAMQSRLGTGVREIDGRIVRLGADSVIMSVSQTVTSTRERFTQQGVTVAIPRPLVQSVQQQTFSRSRTAALTAVTAAVISIALRATSGFGFTGSGEPGGSVQP